MTIQANEIDLSATLPEVGDGNTALLATEISEREREVLQLLAVGKQRAVIAERLCISSSTVHTHLKNIYDKLGAHNAMEAVNVARNFGLIQ